MRWIDADAHAQKVDPRLCAYGGDGGSAGGRHEHEHVGCATADVL